MNIEEIHTTLRGVSRSEGAKFDVVLKWFKECGIIDGRLVDEEFFAHTFERLCPNREDLGLTQMVTLLSIMARETRQSVEDFVTKFKSVKDTIIYEMQDSRRNEQ